MSKNPFNFSKPVKGKDFCNRKEEIKKAIGFIKNLQCFSVVGERRIGKTSLLEHLLSQEVLKEHGIDIRKHTIIWLNVGSLHEPTEDAFIRAMLERLREHTQAKRESGSVRQRFVSYVENLVSDNRNLVIALDEFEIVEPILDEYFPHWFRSVLQKPNIMAITSSQITIGEIGPDGMASPLFNIFGNLFLGLFVREETEKMFSEFFLRGKEELNTEEISFLADLSGGNPYLIQLLGYHYYEERTKNKEVHKNEFEDRMLDHLRDQFEGYWKHLSEEERELLLKIENSSNDQISRTLERKGFVIKKGENWGIFSPLFERFIETKIPKNDFRSRQMRKKTPEDKKSLKKEPRKRVLKSRSILGALLIGIIANLVAICIQKFYPEILKRVPLRIDLLSLIISIVSLVIALIALTKLSSKR